jgi:hypothetical protein
MMENEKMERKRRRENRNNGTSDEDFKEFKRNFEFLRKDEEDDDRVFDKWDINNINEDDGYYRPNASNNNNGRNREENNEKEGERMAKRYENSLYKEFAIPDLSRCDVGIGLRFRTEKEIVTGKGERICAEKRCAERKNLMTFELNFKYAEKEIMKNALVKVVVCPTCGEKLHRSRNLNKKKKKK